MQPKNYFILIWHILATLATLQNATQATATTTTAATTTMSLSVANVQRNDSVAIIAAVVNGNGNDNGQQKVDEEAEAAAAAKGEGEGAWQREQEEEQAETANENNFEQLLSQQLQQEQRAKETATATAKSSSKSKLLSRKRRYLIFPEGSSFQLVYDEIVGVVDYTNYLILGITVALAWELPSKPPSEILEDIKDQLKDGTLGTKRNDTATNITYVDTRPKSTLRPNYINLSGTQTYGGQQAGYDAYYMNRQQLQPVFRPPMHKNYYNHNYRRPDSYYRAPASAAKQKYAYEYGAQKNGWRRKDNYYYSPKPNPFAKWSKQQQRRPNYGFTPYAGSSGKYPWWNLKSRLSNAVRGNGGKPPGPSAAVAAAARRIDNGNSKNQQQQLQQQHQQQQQPRPESGYYQSSAPTTSAAATAARKHRIYPVFGKRSLPDGNTANANNNINSTTPHQQQQQQHHSRQRRSGIAGPQLSKLDRIHIRHHRSTRQSFYEKIEKYLDKRGASGHHCVLRALCETGQKSAEHAPGSFVGELMRAVFTLPEALSEDLHAQRVHYLEQRYDAANAFGGNCAGRYQLCKDSLWMSQFVA